MSTNKYIPATKNNCPTGWWWAVEKHYIVCQTIYTTEAMRFLASFFGSLVLSVFLVGGTVAFNSFSEKNIGNTLYPVLGWFTVPLIHGFGLFVVQASIFAVFGTGNPALSIVFGFAGKYKWRDVLYSLLADTLAWIAGSLIVRIWTTTPLLVSAIPTLQPGVSIGTGFAVEIFASFVWGLALLFHIGKPNQDLMAGLGLASAMWVAWPYTRGALNPHRVLGPAIAAAFFGNTSVWVTAIVIYIFSHFIGFAAALAVYYMSFAMMEDKCAKDKCAKKDDSCHKTQC